MWTKEHRARHEPCLKDMVLQWTERKVACWLERADPPRSAAATPTVAVVRAIARHLRVGGPCAGLELPTGMVKPRERVLDPAEYGKVMASLRVDAVTKLEVRHRWVFRDEFVALVANDVHGCRSEILVPRPLVGELRSELELRSKS